MLRVRVLGELAIEVDGRTVEPPSSRRARALLGWLAVDRRMHSRSTLGARFWPDVLDESARTSLRSALSALRRSLGPDSQRYLIAGRDEVGLAGDALVWTDLAEFERCVADGRPEDALALSRGELLAGFDEDWVYECRDEHRDRVSAVLAQLAGDAEGNRALDDAIAFTRQQVALDPFAEEPLRDLMRRLAASGDRAGAIRAYERLSKRLHAELRIAPSHETRELAQAIRSGGERAGAQAAVPASERAAAVVTLLFTDLVGSTQLLGELGDDEAERLRRAHFGLLRDVAMAHSGQEVKNLGDGLMVAFPSAVNAVSCAVGMQQAVHRYNARRGDDRLRVRVGLNVGEPIRDEDDYFGTPVVVAKRLCDHAEGGQILASELLRALIGSRGSFGFRTCGAIALKGLSESLPACEITWEPAAERRVALPAPFLVDQPAPLVGRDAELHELERGWLEARAGRRRAVVLVGEPGIGKTRLAAEFCRSAYAGGALVLLGRCYEESLAPYQAFVEALRHYVSESPVDELRLAVGPHRATLVRLVPELAEPGAEVSMSPTGESPERDQFLLSESVASLLRAVAAEHPLILVLDDLHWADGPTLLLLRHIVRATEGVPLLILATYRETEVDEAHPLGQALAELRRARALETVALPGLGQQDVAELISSQAGRAAPATVARSIVDRTQGNPFFVEELLREVGTGGDFNDALTRIPESVKDLLLRRLRRLDDDAKRILTYAAVSGREFDLDVLEPAAGVPADRLAESLETAIAGRIVEESTSSIGHYSFAHALIRETIYERLSLTRRAQLHRQIGEAIEDLACDLAGKQFGALAYHFSAAGDTAKAYRYHGAAADAAQRVYAVDAALSHSTAALKAATALGLEPVAEAAVRHLLLQRGRMRLRTGDPGALADLESVLDAARRCGDRASEMESLNELGILRLQTDVGAAAESHLAALEIAQELGDTAAQTNAMDRLSVVYSHLLEFDQALELGERALELARDAGEEALVGRALDGIKLAVWQLGDLQRLEELTGELARLWRQRDDLWYLQFTLQESAFVPLGRARWNEAAQRLAEAAAINARIQDPLAAVLILHALCWLHRSRGAYEESLAAGRQAVALAAQTTWSGWAAEALGWTLLDLGAAAEAADVLERGLDAGQKIGAPNESVRCIGQLAWARFLLGAQDDARALAARAEEMLGQVTGGAFLFGSQAYAATARVLLATGAADRGENLLSPVLAAAERFGWLEAAAMTGLVLGLCQEALGRPDQALATLAQVAAVSDEHGIPATGWEAHVTLARLGAGATHAAAAEAIAERMVATLKDEAQRDRLRAKLNL
jgi:class 3 adenylate cyclase/tetratricopeptide (TPR) repeat protein